MGSTATNGSSICELVFVAFTKTLLSQRKWQSILDDIIASIPKTLNPTSFARGRKTRILDCQNPQDAIRVIKMSVVTRREPATLEECTNACMKDSKMQQVQRDYEIELILQPGELFNLHKLPGLAVFDMDSTLIQQEVIDELARSVGLYDKVAAITEAAMRGEAPYTDFEASLRARVALLKGVPTSIWGHLKTDVIKLSPGAPELIRVLEQLGWKTAVVSGGFTPLANWLKEMLGLDYAFANHLATDSGLNILTGELVRGAPIVHAQRKRELVLQLAKDNAISQQRTIAVGDGSNDLLMMNVAGLGVAFNAKPKVQLAAPARLNGGSLLDIMHILGYTREDVNNLLATQCRP